MTAAQANQRSMHSAEPWRNTLQLADFYSAAPIRVRCGGHHAFMHGAMGNDPCSPWDLNLIHPLPSRSSRPSAPAVSAFAYLLPPTTRSVKC